MNQHNISCYENSCAAGIVSGNPQQMGNLYPVQTALLRGTLYPELDKPLNCAANPSCRTTPSADQMMAFTAWEVRLYLDTHPYDAAALQLYQQLCQQTQKPSYACAFVPCEGMGWNWVDDPWPWECAANGRRD